MSRPTETVSRRQFVAAAGTVGAVSLAGCTALVTGSGESDDFDVGMTANGFTPPEITVSVGEEVVWRNTSARAHTVTAYENAIPDGAAFFASGGFDGEQEARIAWRDGLGGRIDSGESFRHTFEMPGRHDYFCVPHEQAGMIGAIVVEP